MKPDLRPLQPLDVSKRPRGRWAIVLIIIPVFLAWAGVRVYRGHSGGVPQRFVVQRGESPRQIARHLESESLVAYPRLFMLWSRLHPSASLKPGIYEIAAGEAIPSIFRKLRRGPPKVRLTLPEGWTSRQMAKLLNDKGISSTDDFLKVVAERRLEGYLFPDTYFFEQGTDPGRVASRLKERFDEMKPSDFSERAKALKLSETQLVTLASLVEREAHVPDERPVIAGVFLNRLRKHWRLESCATVEYALGQWKPKLTYKDLDVDSPYNTYRHAGLPPGPIANPGQAALEAAAHPSPTEAMFFVAEGGGTHRFSKYYAEHLRAQKGKRRPK